MIVEFKMKSFLAVQILQFMEITIYIKRPVPSRCLKLLRLAIGASVGFF
jgi:hypothetical protein